MSDIPKITPDIISGKKKPPAGYELKIVHHNEYSYEHPASGKKVIVKAHDERFLKLIKKPAAGEVKEQPAVNNKHVSKKAARKAAKKAKK